MYNYTTWYLPCFIFSTYLDFTLIATWYACTADDYSSKYKSYDSEPYVPVDRFLVVVNTSIILSTFGTICKKSRVSSRRCRLERAITIDHRKKHKQHSFLGPMDVVRSQECTTSAVGGSRGVELGSLLHRTRLQIPVEEKVSPSQHCPVR